MISCACKSLRAKDSVEGFVVTESFKESFRPSSSVRACEGFKVYRVLG